MNQLQLPPGTDATMPRTERRQRHGLIEDWRDALGIVLLLFVAAFLGAVLSRFWPETEVRGETEFADMETRLSAIEGKLANLSQSRDMTAARTRIDTLEKRLSTVEASFAALGEPASADKTAPALQGPQATAAATLLATAKRVEAMAQRLTELETRTASLPEDLAKTKATLETLAAGSTGVQTSLNELSTRMSKLEASDILDLARRASVASAVANLTRAAQGSSPFRTEYDVVAGLLPGNNNLLKIQRHAATGLPTTGTLISTFGNTATAALAAERNGKGSDGMSRLWSNVSGLVTWRSTSETAGSSTESRLARAEIRLKAGDLAAAVKELSAIRGSAARALSTWLQKAQARVSVEATLAELNTQAIDAIQSRPAGETPPTQTPAP